MKMNKKKVFALALAVCLIATLSMGSLAWFTDEDAVTNKFYIASSEDDTADEIFSVDVYEEYDSNGDGTDEEYQVGITYTDILPGDVLQKEAYVKNTGYYDQYVRVTVTISDAKAWIDALGANFDVTKVFAGFEIGNWNHIWNNLNGATEIPENIVYVLYYKDILESGKQVTVFTGVNIPNTLTTTQAAAFGGNFSIDIKAEAVQTENVVPEGTDAADAAWAAFQTVGTIKANP